MAEPAAPSVNQLLAELHAHRVQTMAKGRPRARLRARLTA
jgi:hypothetical protein